MSKSLIQEEKKCIVCDRLNNLHKHHVFYGTANRKKAEQDGCWVWLCAYHHNMSKEGVHFNKKLDMLLKIKMEIAWINYYDKTINDFIKRYGKNYLDYNTDNFAKEIKINEE